MHAEPPFPPAELMHSVSALTSEKIFAAHGRHILAALAEASPKPLEQYRRLLDFGCGCGRLLRMFNGHPGDIHGCDIDRRHVEWVDANLPYVKAKLSFVDPPLPYASNSFDAIISVSVFSHLAEGSQFAFLADLARICRPGGLLFLTIHGDHALRRAETEEKIRAMINVPDEGFELARQAFRGKGYAFIVQQDHLTNNATHRSDLVAEPYEYGITFISHDYIRRHWTQWFDILEIREGAIHKWQDIVVARPKSWHRRLRDRVRNRLQFRPSQQGNLQKVGWLAQR